MANKNDHPSHSPYKMPARFQDKIHVYRWFSDASGTLFDMEKGFTASLCVGLRAQIDEGYKLHLSGQLLEHHLTKHLDWNQKEGSALFSMSTTIWGTYDWAEKMRNERPLAHTNLRIAETTIGDLRGQGCQIIASEDFGTGRGWEIMVTGWAPIEIFSLTALGQERGALRKRGNPMKGLPYQEWLGPLPLELDPFTERASPLVHEAAAQAIADSSSQTTNGEIRTLLDDAEPLAERIMEVSRLLEPELAKRLSTSCKGFVSVLQAVASEMGVATRGDKAKGRATSERIVEVDALNFKSLTLG